MDGLLTEGVREVDIVDVDEGNADPASDFVVGERVAVGADDGTDDDERDAGSCGAAHEEGASSQAVDEEDGWDGAEAVDDSVDAGCKEGCLVQRVSVIVEVRQDRGTYCVATQAERLEHGWGVVDHCFGCLLALLEEVDGLWGFAYHYIP